MLKGITVMKILVVEPEKEPYVKDIENELSDMQEVVGGLIEPIYFPDDDKALVFCNEEFLLNGSEPNRMVEGTLVHGTFFVAGNTENDEGELETCSLTDEQIEKYSEKFAEPVQDMDLYNGGMTVIFMM